MYLYQKNHKTIESMEKNLEKLKYSLLHNNPNLFIGAGFSLGAFQRNGLPVPSGRALKENIITNILGFAKGSAEYAELLLMPLYKLCSYTYVEKGKDTIYEYLKNIFQGVKPCPFHKSFIVYPWNKVFSTNIDDIIENICANEKAPIIVRNEKNNTQAKSNNEIDLYKLHGCINNIEAGLIFDEEEYLSTIVDRSDYRFNVLSIELQNKDFVFVGSDFDDFNVKYYLNLYSSSTDSSVSSRGNLFFINPYPSLTFRNNIKRVNGILIEYTAEQFADFLTSLEVDRESIDETKLLYDGYIKIKQKQLNASSKAKYNSDLYTGAYPKWEDIFYDWDVLLPTVVSDFTKKLNDFTVSHKKSLVFALTGKGYSGKSVVLKRLAQILIHENYEAISFEGQNFSTQKILRYIKSTNYEKYALVIDDASYLYGEFEYLCKKVPDNVKLCIISSSRQFFHSKRRYSLVDINCIEYDLQTSVDRSLAENIIDKLNDRGYLGLILPDFPNREDQIHFAQYFSDIASAIFAITHGKNFKIRFTHDVNEILKNGYHRDVFIKLAIIQKLQLPYFPRSLFTKLYKKQSFGFLKRIEDIIRSTDATRIELKNEFIGDIILKNTTHTEILQSLRTILIAISSMVENSSNSYWNELHSVLIREKLIKDTFKIKSEHFKDMLYQLRPYYSENYNYWLQLGIAEQIDGDLDKALIHFNQAQKYGPRSYMVKNAIGRNFIFQALKENDNTVAKQLFLDGKNRLLELIQDREEYQAKAYSTHTYLTGLMRFYKTKNDLKISNEEIREGQGLIDGMLKRYKDDPMFSVLESAWAKFILRYSSGGMKFNLSELQYLYKDGEIDDINFADLD